MIYTTNVFFTALLAMLSNLSLKMLFGGAYIKKPISLAGFDTIQYLLIIC